MNNTVLKDDELFIVTMYRYGDFYGHSYMLCVTDNYDLAVSYEEEEWDNRGNKYYGEIVKRKLNHAKKFEVVRKLDDHPNFN